MRTRRFELDGKCRVVLFTSKTIKIGDKFHYDYISGLQDKQVKDWEKIGFMILLILFERLTCYYRYYHQC